jgi:hypothetical protein
MGPPPKLGAPLFPLWPSRALGGDREGQQLGWVFSLVGWLYLGLELGQPWVTSTLSSHMPGPSPIPPTRIFPLLKLQAGGGEDDPIYLATNKELP